MLSFSEYIKQECAKEGFFDCSISNSHILSKEKQFHKEWIANGYHGNMKYLENNLDMRFDPSLLMPGTKSIITVLLNYYPQEKMPIADNYRIAKYAYGQDYHYIVKDKLKRVAEKCQEEFGHFEYRAFTDSAPIPDRVWAKKGGLGWIGKNTLLINKQHGSYFVIGHLFMDKKLTPDKRYQEDLCLDCTKCIDACPTDALFLDTELVEGPNENTKLTDTSIDSVSYKIDARKCLSYQTIENKSAEKDIPPNKFRNWIFGCDICQDVCPFNKNPEATSVKEFTPHPNLFSLRKADWHNLKPMGFGEIFRGTPVKRAGYMGLFRNIEWVEK
jgi:epoxyqueuosine reductase